METPIQISEEKLQPGVSPANSVSSDSFFPTRKEKKKAIGLIHRAYLTQLKNSRIHTASTKTRAEVRGGGRKPWKQKGTGNARAGSTSSPLWTGGGVIFGPKPRIVRKKINKKERRLAILSAFYLKTSSFCYLENSRIKELTEAKTKSFFSFLSSLGMAKNRHILVILPQPNPTIWLATKNLKNVEVTTARCLNIEQLLRSQAILLFPNSLEIINATYGKNAI